MQATCAIRMRRFSRAVPPHLYTLQLATAFICSKSLHAAAQLGVADALWDAAAQRPRALTAVQLAEEVGADPARLLRLMRALAGLGVFRQLEGGEAAPLAAPLPLWVSCWCAGLRGGEVAALCSEASCGAARATGCVLGVQSTCSCASRPAWCFLW